MYSSGMCGRGIWVGVGAARGQWSFPSLAKRLKTARLQRYISTGRFDALVATRFLLLPSTKSDDNFTNQKYSIFFLLSRFQYFSFIWNGGTNNRGLGPYFYSEESVE